jgi:hypothetical protein
MGPGRRREALEIWDSRQFDRDFFHKLGAPSRTVGDGLLWRLAGCHGCSEGKRIMLQAWANSAFSRNPGCGDICIGRSAPTDADWC